MIFPPATEQASGHKNKVSPIVTAAEDLSSYLQTETCIPIDALAIHTKMSVQEEQDVDYTSQQRHKGKDANETFPRIIYGDAKKSVFPWSQFDIASPVLG